MEGRIIDREEREAMKAVEANEIKIHNDMRTIEMQEEHKRQGIKPFHYVPKLIDVTEADSITKQIFCITGITNNTASIYGREIAIAGRFLDKQQDFDWSKSQFFIVIGKRSHRALCLGEWVFSCTAMFRVPGTVFFYLSLDGRTPISQILKFDHLSTPTNAKLFSTVVGFRQQLCLAYLLHSGTKNLIDQPMPNSCVPSSFKDKILLERILHFCKRTKTATFIRLIQHHGFPLIRGESLYLRFLLEQKLREWISERLEEGCITDTHNIQGLQVIHMLAILGYRWLIRMYSELGRGKLSLDIADVAGWTALHWAHSSTGI
ncbi:hypothetical protein MKX03_005595 [Papaver bracteatum]|nr:hypothetical protein MKX03_005595 [Papaver bracteatum]